MSDRDPANTKRKLLEEIEQAPDGLLRELLEYAQSLRVKRESAGRSFALASEPALAKDWLSPEEDDAWAGL